MNTVNSFNFQLYIFTTYILATTKNWNIGYKHF